MSDETVFRYRIHSTTFGHRAERNLWSSANYYADRSSLFHTHGPMFPNKFFKEFIDALDRAEIGYAISYEYYTNLVDDKTIGFLHIFVDVFKYFEVVAIRILTNALPLEPNIDLDSLYGQLPCYMRYRND